jgi:hypothetical protein
MAARSAPVVGSRPLLVLTVCADVTCEPLELPVLVEPPVVVLVVVLPPGFVGLVGLEGLPGLPG